MIGNSEEKGLICFAARFTFHGLRLRRFMLRSLRFAVDISLLTPFGLFKASPVYATRFTFHGLCFAVYGFAGNLNITTIKIFI